MPTPAVRVRENSNPNFGFNAQSDQYEDLVLSGVIDATKVTRKGSAKRRVDRLPDVDHRSHGSRDPEKKAAPAGSPGHGPDMDY